jgi:hypothetical protein
MADIALTRLTPSLALRTAQMARRLADLVTSLGSDDEPSIERFLRAMADARVGEATAARPLERVADALALSTTEVDLIVLAGLAEEHEGYAAALRLLSPTHEPFATCGLAARLLSPATTERVWLRELLERGAAVTAGALSIEGRGPFFERELRVGERLWPALHEIDVWPAAVHESTDHVELRGLEEWLASVPARRAVAAVERRAPVTILVTADSERVALARGAALVASAGAEPVPLDTEAWTADLLQLVCVHALARDCVPVLAVPRVDGPEQPPTPDPVGHPGPVVLCARPGGVAPRGLRPVVSVPVEPLSARALRRLWSATLPELSTEASLLAARHPVEPAEAAEIAADVRALGGGTVSAADVSRSIRVRAGLSLAAGVKLVRPTATWDDLVLPPDRVAQLREALDRLRHQDVVLDDWGFLAGRRGARGVRMLLAGPPGTGKTLSAEVLAAEFGVDLLVVDISRVVSKWIGETEKNLAEVFDAAERAQAVLFFDEADALFGRRTEVSDAHDRYANLETAYLLARLEGFEGLAVLATNLRQNIDSAFTRRLEFAIDYDEPTAVQREALWRCHLPEGTPIDSDVDLTRLATMYPVVGGVIRNAATAAAFLAAAEQTPIGRRHFVAAVRREYEKAGRAFPGAPIDEHVGRTHG